MKSSFTSALLGVTLTASAQVPATEFRVFGGGQAVGKAYAKLEPQSTGGRRFVLTMMLKLGGRDLQVRTEAMYDRSGFALRRVQETGKPGKAPDERVIAVFASDKATVTTERGGKTLEKVVSIDEKLPRTDALMTWTPNRFPAVGGEHASYSFDMSGLTFQMAKSFYEGVDELDLGGMKVKGHRIVTEARGNRYEMWVDEAGMPYRMSLGTFRLDRVLTGVS